MADTQGNISGDNTLGNVVALLGLLQNKKSTTTSSSSVSSDSMNAMLQKILEGTQGLAAVSSGQRSAGGYNSTVNTQLTNDLLTRASGEVLSQNRSTTQTTATPGVLSGNTGKLIAAFAAYQKLKKDKTVGEYTDKFSDFFSKITGSNVDTSGYPSGGDPYSSLNDVAAQLDGQVGGNIDFSALLGNDSTSSASNLGAGADMSDTGFDWSSLGKSSGATDSATVVSSASDSADAINAAETANVAGTAGQTSDAFAGASSTAGSYGGYINTAIKAYSAYNGNKDYRETVGSGILTALGYGYLTPVAKAILEPISNNVMREGNEYGGIAGSFYSEPIGTVVSGKYDEEDILPALTDPADLFGGNEGGSIGAIVGASADPLGAALGGKGYSDDVSDFVNDGLDSIANFFGW